MSKKPCTYIVSYGEPGCGSARGLYGGLKKAIKVYRDYVSDSRCNMGAVAGMSVELVDVEAGKVIRRYKSPSARGLSNIT